MENSKASCDPIFLNWSSAETQPEEVFSLFSSERIVEIPVARLTIKELAPGIVEV
jgi:hypothetical protein